MRRVLIVEDDEVRCAWFRARLAGWEIDITCDARQAVELLSERHYAAVLLDHDLVEEHYFSDAEDDERTGYAVAPGSPNTPTPARRDRPHPLAQLHRGGAHARRLIASGRTPSTCRFITCATS